MPTGMPLPLASLGYRTPPDPPPIPWRFTGPKSDPIDSLPSVGQTYTTVNVRISYTMTPDPGPGGNARDRRRRLRVWMRRPSEDFTQAVLQDAQRQFEDDMERAIWVGSDVQRG